MRTQIQRTAWKMSAAVFAMAVVTLPAAHAYTPGRAERCALMADLGHQIAAWRDSGISEEAVKAQVEPSNSGFVAIVGRFGMPLPPRHKGFEEGQDRSRLSAYRAFVELIYRLRALDPAVIEKSVLAACITR